MMSFFKNKTIWIVLGVTGLVFTITYISYKNMRKIYVQAEIAYHFNDEDLALAYYHSVSEYPNIFGDSIINSQTRILELQAYIDAQQLWDSSEYDQAIEHFDAFVKSYPDSGFIEEGHSALKLIPFQWADKLVFSKDYPNAIAKYKEIVDNFNFNPEEILQANNSIFAVYQEWGSEHYDLDEFNKSIEVYLQFAEWLEKQNRIGNRSDDDIQQINTIIQDIYLEWAKTSYGAQEFAEAVEIYLAYEKWAITSNYQDRTEIESELVWVYFNWGRASAIDDDYEQAVKKMVLAIEFGTDENVTLIVDELTHIYLLWAIELEEDGKDAEAGEKYWLLMEGYPDSEATSKMNEQAYPAMVIWGHALFEAGEFEESQTVYERILGLVDEKEKDLLFLINLDLGQIAHHDEQYLDALNYYLIATEKTEELEKNEELLENAQQLTLDLIGNDTSSQGQELLYMMVANTAGRLTGDGDKCIEFSDNLGTVCINPEMTEMLSLAVGTNPDDVRLLILFTDRNNNIEFHKQLGIDFWATNLGSFHYFFSIKESIVITETCKKNSSSKKYNHSRGAIKYEVSVIEMNSGNLITNHDFLGGEPKPCQNSAISIYGDLIFIGSPPDLNNVSDWINSVIQ